MKDQLKAIGGLVAGLIGGVLATSMADVDIVPLFREFGPTTGFAISTFLLAMFIVGMLAQQQRQQASQYAADREYRKWHEIQEAKHLAEDRAFRERMEAAEDERTRRYVDTIDQLGEVIKRNSQIVETNTRVLGDLIENYSMMKGEVESWQQRTGESWRQLESRMEGLVAASARQDRGWEQAEKSISMLHTTVTAFMALIERLDKSVIQLTKETQVERTFRLYSARSADFQRDPGDAGGGTGDRNRNPGNQRDLDQPDRAPGRDRPGDPGGDSGSREQRDREVDPGTN